MTADEHTEKAAEMYRCERCDGMGEIPHGWPRDPKTTWHRCPACNGSGEMTADDMEAFLESTRP